MILWTNMETISPTICPWCHMENKISTQVWKCLNDTNFTFTSQTALDTPEQSTSDPIMTSQSTSFFNKLWLEATKCFIFSSRRVLFCWNATSCYFYTTHIATSFQAFSRSNDSEKIIECVTRKAYTLYPLFLIRIKQGSTIEGKIIWLLTFFQKSLADLADLAVTKFYWVTAVTEARMAKTKISVYRYTALTV